MSTCALDLTYEEFKKQLSPEDTLATVPGLYFSPRNGRVLIVEPESASWLVLTKEDSRF